MRLRKGEYYGVTSRFNKATKFHQYIQYIFPSAHQNCQQLAVPVPISNLIPGDVEQGLEKQWLTHPLQSFHCDSDRTSANRSALSICSGGMGSKHAPSVHLTLTILYIVDFQHSEHTSPKLVYIHDANDTPCVSLHVAPLYASTMLTANDQD